MDPLGTDPARPRGQTLHVHGDRPFRGVWGQTLQASRIMFSVVSRGLSPQGLVGKDFIKIRKWFKHGHRATDRRKVKCEIVC